MLAIDPADSLAPDQAARLGDFARACKAAARVVALYPASHPAIRSALERVVETSERLRGNGTVSLTVLPDGILLEGRPPAKPDPALGELATLLHAHLVGELTIIAAPSTSSWHTFLSLLARAPDEIRAVGGIGRAWAASEGGPIEIRQIDYAEVLRERPTGMTSDWDRIISNYLEGELSDLDDDAIAALFDIAGDQTRFQEFTERLVAEASAGGRRGKKDAVLRVLQALANYVARTQPDQLDRILHQIAGVMPRLTPEMVVTLITVGAPSDEAAPAGIDLPGEVRARVTDKLIAEFVAQSVARDLGATERLAQAFQTLVPDHTARERMLDLAETEMGRLPLSRSEQFPKLWKSAVSLLTTYSDTSFVSTDYARELSTARTHAIELERVTDDPQDRINGWLSTVNDHALRRLDQQVLLDLLRIETRASAWQKVLETALTFIDQLVLTGHITLAQELLSYITDAAAEGAPFAAIANEGLDRLRFGPLMPHVVLFIRQARAEEEIEAAGLFCRTLGPAVIGALAEALAVEQTKITVQRLRDVLLSFGAAGRAYADELRKSENPAVRRTAIELLRAFGGADALPDLASLLDDAEPAVQREALRAIIQIGTNDAYATLEEALKRSSGRTRDAILQALAASRDERAAPLFVYMIEHTDYRGRFEAVYLTAVEALGRVGGDEESVAALKKALYQGEWWAPFRTARIRMAAALSLRQCGADTAGEVLEEAAVNGPRGVRRAARTALSAPAPRRRRADG